MDVLKKLNELLDKRQKRIIVLLIGMMTVGTVFETISLSMLIPIVTLFVSPDALDGYSWLLKLFSFLGIGSPSESVAEIIVLAIVLYLIKGVYQVFQEYMINTFIANNQCGTMRSLFATYIQRPYEYYLYADSASIIRIITTDVNQMYALLLALLHMCSETIMVAGMFCVLLLTDVKIALLTIALAVIILIISKISFRKILNRAGRREQESGSKAIKYIQQAILAIKEIKIISCEAFFWDRYSKSAKENMQARRIGNLLASAIKPMLETLGITMVLLYLLYMIRTSADLSLVLPKLLVFVTIMVRSLPLINAINGRLNNIAYYEPFLMQMKYDASLEKVLYQKIQIRSQEICAGAGAKDDTIEVRDLVYRYPGTEKVILNHVNLNIPAGKCIGIVGPSGSGKSTLVDVILGLLKPEQGQVFWNGENLNTVYAEFLGRVAYIPQMVTMLDDSIYHNIAFGVEEDQIDEKRVWQVLKEAQLQEFVAELPEGLETVIGERGIRISGGQRQRIGIARALYRNPQILIFDEATSALDHITEKAIIEAIHLLREGRTIIMIAHRLNTLEDCDAIYRVEDGSVFQVKQGE